MSEALSRVEGILQGDSSITPQSRVEALLAELVVLAGSTDEETVKGYISEAISDLIDGAPETYDTLKELADWISSHQETYTALATLVASKQDLLTFDQTPTANSTNPVTSGGVASALAAVQSLLTFDEVPTAGSNNPVKSSGVKSAVDTATMIANTALTAVSSIRNFDATVSYSAGDYVFYNGVLYKFTSAHAAGAWTGNDVEESNLGEDLTDLKGAFNNIVTELLDVISGGYIANSGNIDVNTVVPESTMRYVLEPCSAGDIFIINGTGGAGVSKTLYAFCSSDGTNLGKSANNETAVNKKIIAPTNAAYLVINLESSSTSTLCYRYDNVATSPERIDALETIVHDNIIIGLNYSQGSFSGSTGDEVPGTTAIRSNDSIKITDGCIFTIENGYSYSIWGWNNGVFLGKYNGTEFTMSSATWFEGSRNFNELAASEYDIRFLIKKANGDTITAADGKKLCIRINAMLKDLRPIENEIFSVNNDIGSIKDLIGVETIPLINGGYISNTGTIDITNIIPEASMKYAVAECSAGDIFIINGTGGAGIAKTLYAFCSSDGTNLGKSANNETAVNKKIIAPMNAAYLVINLESSSTSTLCYKDNGSIIIKVDETEVPDYWKTHLEAKSALINAAYGVNPINTDGFVFITDIHYPDYNFGGYGKLIKYIMETSNVQKMVMGGDLIQSTNNAISKYSDIINELSFTDRNYPTIGNHDASESTFYFMSKRHETNIVREFEDRYFFDSPTEKIRYIVIDSRNPDSGGISSDQTSWAKSRIQELTSGWGYIIFTHGLWIAANRTETTLEQSVDYATIIDLLDDVSTATAKLIAVISGHCHRDYSETTASGYLLIGTTCDANGYMASFDPVAYTRTEGTATEHAFDVYIINRQIKKITVIRIGAGNNREFTYN